MLKRSIVAIAIALLLASPLGVFAQTLDLPEPTGYVNDFENILNNDQEIESKISSFQQETSNEIAVVTVTDFQGLTIEEFAVELFEEWGIGTDENDNGVLILISATQRESRIEVGYGLEGALPDAMTGRIQDNEMIPYFRDGDYSTGVSKGVDAVISATAGEYTMEDAVTEGEDFPIIAVIMIIIFIIILSKIFGSFPVVPVVSGIARSSGFSSGGFRSFGGGRSSGSSGGFGGFGGGRSGGGGSSRSW